MAVIYIRVSDELAELLRQQARLEQRSISAQARVALQEHLGLRPARPSGRNGTMGQPHTTAEPVAAITQAQADAIAEVLREEYEANSAFRAIVDAKASNRRSKSPASPPAGDPRKGAAA